MREAVRRVTGLLKRFWTGTRLPDCARLLAGPLPAPYPEPLRQPDRWKCSRCLTVLTVYGMSGEWYHPILFHRCIFTLEGSSQVYQYTNGAPAFPVDQHGDWL